MTARKYIQVGIPMKVYEELKRMKENKEIMSISEFVRHAIYLALDMRKGNLGSGRIVRRMVSVEEVIEWKPIKRRKDNKPPGLAIFGQHVRE